jgi:hypothetical protein
LVVPVVLGFVVSLTTVDGEEVILVGDFDVVVVIEGLEPVVDVKPVSVVGLEPVVDVKVVLGLPVGVEIDGFEPTPVVEIDGFESTPMDVRLGESPLVDVRFDEPPKLDEDLLTSRMMLSNGARSSPFA